MKPIVTAQTGPTRFRLRWFGYDRAEVDEFLRLAAVERQMLQEDLAQLPAVIEGHREERRRELERLITLRSEVANCLESSIGALRTATQRLSEPGQVAPRRSPAPEVEKAVTRARRFQLPIPVFRQPVWPSGARMRVMVALLLVAGLIPAMILYRSSARENPESNPADSAMAERPNTSEPSAAPVPGAEQSQGLSLTLTAIRECWLSMRVDGGQPLDRLLKVNETIILRANEEAVLRVGDAGAISMLINSEPARPLGPTGQVVTTRITRGNYRTFLASKP
jgi:DivIVA domain-containing protein